MTHTSPGGSAKRVRFRDGIAPKQATHPPPPPASLAALVERRSHLQASSIERSTYAGYRVALRDWLYFCKLYSLNARPTVESTTLYITYCDLRSIASIPSYLAGLSFFFTQYCNDWPAIRQSPSVLRTLCGAAKNRARPIIRKDPLRVPDIFLFLADRSTYDDRLFCVILVIGFLGIMRLSELVIPDNAKLRVYRKIVTRPSLQFARDGSSLSFTLPYHKADSLYMGSTIVIRADPIPHLDAVSLVQNWVTERDGLFPGSPFLFLTAAGSPPTRGWFLSRFRRHCGPSYGGHSLCAGGATFYADLSVPTDTIRQLGRWKSATFEIYIRNHPSVSLAIYSRAQKPRPAALLPSSSSSTLAKNSDSSLPRARVVCPRGSIQALAPASLNDVSLHPPSRTIPVATLERCDRFFSLTDSMSNQ
jgi:hypothetical protein